MRHLNSVLNWNWNTFNGCEDEWDIEEFSEYFDD